MQELCLRIVRYEIVTSIAWCVLFIALTAITYFVAKKLHRLAIKDDYDIDEFFPVCAIIMWSAFGVCAIISIIIVFVEAFDIIKCLTIPERVIVGYLKSV